MSHFSTEFMINEDTGLVINGPPPVEECSLRVVKWDFEEQRATFYLLKDVPSHLREQFNHLIHALDANIKEMMAQGNLICITK